MGRFSFGLNAGAAFGIVALLVVCVMALAGACHGGINFGVNTGFGR